MGRPVNKKYCKGGIEGGIKVTAKIGNSEPSSGVILKQKNTTSYKVEAGEQIDVCRLVDKEVDQLGPYEMVINAKDIEGNVFRVLTLKGRTLKTNAGSYVPWSLDPDSDSSLLVETVTSPNFDPSYEIYDPVTTVGEPSRRFLKSNGTLITGSGNPSGEMIVVTNGEVEVAARAGYYRDVTLVAPVDNVYNITLKDDQDWNVPFNVGLINNVEKSIAEIYDVSLTLTMPNDMKVELFLEEIEGALHLKNSDGSIDIIDSSHDEANSFVQNIQRLSFLLTPETAPEIEFNGAGAPLGTYRFDLKATRKIGSYPEVKVSFTVEARLEEVDPIEE